MSVGTLAAIVVLAFAAWGYRFARSKAQALRKERQRPLHSLPSYYGYYVALWCGVPALILLAVWGLGREPVGQAVIEADFAEATLQDLRTAASEETERSLEDVFASPSAARSVFAEAAAKARQAGPDTLPAPLSTLFAEPVPNAQDFPDLARTILERRDTEQVLNQLTTNLAATNSSRFQRIIGDATAIASGQQATFTDDPVRQRLAERYAGLMTIGDGAFAVLALATAIAGFSFARRHIQAQFPARRRVEFTIQVVLFLFSLVAILTTIGIVLSLLFEAMRFFGRIPFWDFLFGLQWSPQIALRAEQTGQSGAFGAIPLFAGTLLITFIAMMVAVPIGLFAAIYLSEYAGERVRTFAKPLLEILAGIPTVVYGFFALLTVGPNIRRFFEWLSTTFNWGLDVSTQSALSAGVVMGVMIIPFVSSLSDDVIASVPRSLRDGSFGMGATRSETITKVILPAALPGVMGAVLLAISRAIGETMIVVMAAGKGANLTANPLEAVTTVTVQIVSLLTGDTEFDSAKTLSAFALGLTLFVVTLVLNIVALRIVQKYRNKYE
jgi:phosphate transport system permease protein